MERKRRAQRSGVKLGMRSDDPLPPRWRSIFLLLAAAAGLAFGTQYLKESPGLVTSQNVPGATTPKGAAGPRGDGPRGPHSAPPYLPVLGPIASAESPP